jgi:hypothetical protein
MSKLKIHLSPEGKRGCGYRKAGKEGYGLYLVGEGIFEPCERLPFPLTICPCCGHGIGFFRGFKKINPSRLFAPDAEPICTLNSPHNHHGCPLCNPEEVAGDLAGLMWVGKGHYTPAEFTREAMTNGISKKLPGPNSLKGFEVGKHYVYLAHLQACVSYEFGEDLEERPGIFMVFKPRRLEIVVDTEDPEQLPETAKKLAEDLGDRARLLKVARQQEAQQETLPLGVGA